MTGARNGLIGVALVATVVLASLAISVYHVLSHSAPLVPTVLGQGLLLVTAVAFAGLSFLVLARAERPADRDLIGVRAVGGYLLATAASVLYSVHQVLTPEAGVGVDVVLFQATFVGTAGGIAGLLIGRETARHKRTIEALGETTEELERSRARTEAEKRRFESLFQNAPMLVVDVRREGDALRIEDANDPFADLAGSAAVDASGRDLLAAVDHGDASVGAGLRAAVDSGEQYRAEVTLGERGEEHYKLRVVPYRAADDSPAAFVIYLDVTELREAKRALEDRYEAADAALETRNRQLQQSTEHLNQFAYVASHDLQEPLRMVASYVDLLADEYGDELDEEAGQYMAYAVDGAERMQAMVEALLEYSRVSTGEVTFSEFDAGDIVAGVREDLLDEDTRATITVGELPTVEADVDMFAKLFEHLLENAIRHGGVDGEPATVEVTGRESDDEWVFRVADDGPGIPADQQDRIFEIFEQRNRQSTGTGIGLAVCQRIADRHGGDLRVESTEGEGATFHVTIPTSDRARTEAASRAADVERL